MFPPFPTRCLQLYGLSYYVGEDITHIFIVATDGVAKTVLKLRNYHTFFSWSPGWVGGCVDERRVWLERGVAVVFIRQPCGVAGVMSSGRVKTS